jgi:hypothetical protein
MAAATLTQIIDRMVVLENHATEGLVAVNSAFVAQRMIPTTIASYPRSFRLPPRGEPGDRATAAIKRGRVDWRFFIEIAIMVGSRSNDLSSLLRLVERYIYPLYDLYDRHHTLTLPDGTAALEGVRNVTGRMFRTGNFTFYDTEHSGVIVPFEVDVTRERDLAV